jgi:pyrroline-5-carboxylate reductase
MTDPRLGVIGLGEMGSALASAFLRAGFPTCVWNRTADKARPILDAGAVLADGPADAAARSDVLVVCVSTYEIADSLLRDLDAEANLKDKTIVQLTTGTPKQGREASAWADLDQALLSGMLGLIVGVVSGAGVCEAENIPVEEYAKLLRALMPTSVQEAQQITERIGAGDLRETEAALKTWAGAVDHMIESRPSGGGSDEFPAFLQRLFHRASDAGYGDYDIAALIEVLRQR